MLEDEIRPEPSGTGHPRACLHGVGRGAERAAAHASQGLWGRADGRGLRFRSVYPTLKDYFFSK
jgi:hypothetical protein